MKVNYMKMIMAKGVFKMRAAEAWTCACLCVCARVHVCVWYVALFEGGVPPQPLTPGPSCPMDASTTLQQWK